MSGTRTVTASTLSRIPGTLIDQVLELDHDRRLASPVRLMRSVSAHTFTGSHFKLVRDSGPSRTLNNPADHPRTSDGRRSRYVRQLDAVDLTECAGTVTPRRAFRPAITSRTSGALRPIRGAAIERVGNWSWP